MDITEHQTLGFQNSLAQAKAAGAGDVVFPEKPVFQDTVRPLLSKLDAQHMQDNLKQFTSFYTRYYKVPPPSPLSPRGNGGG